MSNINMGSTLGVIVTKHSEQQIREVECRLQKGACDVLGDSGCQDFRLRPFLSPCKCGHFDGTAVAIGHSFNSWRSLRRNLSAFQCSNQFLVFLS